MNRLSRQQRVQVISALCEGSSIRSASRMTGVAMNTVVKLLIELGSACWDYQDAVMRNLPCQRLQCDEIWSFCYAKEKNVAPEHQGELGYGDVWTWTAIDAETKLIPCWLVGKRSTADAEAFISDLASRLRGRVQLTTDGHKPYLQADECAYGADIDDAMLIKLCGNDGSDERQNLTMRMSMRRFTRLTNASSKKLANHMDAVALYFAHYNFTRPHKTLSKVYPTTPAMAAGLTDHVWTVGELLDLLGDSN